MLPQSIPAGAEEITVSDTAKTVLQFIRDAISDPGWNPPLGANSFNIQVKTNAIRYSGSFTPTTTNGFKTTTNNSIPFPKTLLDSIQIIRDSTNDATITVEIYKDNLNQRT